MDWQTKQPSQSEQGSSRQSAGAKPKQGRRRAPGVAEGPVIVSRTIRWDGYHPLDLLEQLEMQLGYTFQNRLLLREALTHSSFSAEQPGTPNNERLEFLGDAALKLTTTRLLLSAFPNEREGFLTRVRAWLISDRHLGGLDLGRVLGDELLVGKVLKSQPEQGLLQRRADCLEAVIGAVFADGGFVAADALICRMFEPKIDQVIQDYQLGAHENQSVLFKDHKTLLQERCIAERGQYPRYEELPTPEVPHAQPTFHIVVFLGEQQVGEGRGQTKKAAGQEAARVALQQLFSTSTGARE